MQIAILCGLLVILMFLGQCGVRPSENQVFLFRLLLPFVEPILIMAVLCVIGFAIKKKGGDQVQVYHDSRTQESLNEVITQDEVDVAGDGSAEDVYQKPHGASDYWFADEETRRRFDRENEEYELEWQYSKGQRDRLANRHLRPHSPIDRWGSDDETKDKYRRENEAYQEGWDNADNQI